MTQHVAFISSLLLLAACGKDSSNEELCENQCDMAQDWTDGCADEFAEGDWEVETAGEACVTECIGGADEATEADCATQWEAASKCFGDISVESLECEPLSLVEAMLEECAIQMSALEACNPTVSDDTGS